MVLKAPFDFGADFNPRTISNLEIIMVSSSIER